MTAIADYVAGVVGFLESDASVSTLGDVIAPEVRNTDVATMPRKLAVVRPAGGPGGFNEGYAYVRAHRVDVSCFGETPFEAMRLHLAAYGALIQMRRVGSNSALLLWAHAESSGFALRDPDTEWPFVLSTWQVGAAEEEVVT